MPEFPVTDFLTQQEQELASRVKNYKAMSNNVSAIGHPCTRYLVYKRTEGDKADPYSPDLQALFDEGNTQEQTTVAKIKELGYKHERSQEAIEIPDLQIRGKIDGVVMQVAAGKIVGKWACEIKKVNEYVYDKMHVWEDLYDSPWHYRWLVQLQLAIFHVSKKPGFDDTGVIFLKNTAKNLVKPISVPMNQQIIEEAFTKARAINTHIAAGTVPDRCAYTLGLCQGCEFRRICAPDEPFMAGENIEDPAFVEKLRRREKLADDAKEFNSLDRDVKDILRGKVYAVAGPFRITGREFGKGWKVEIERVMADADMEQIAHVFPQAQKPAPAAATVVPDSEFKQLMEQIDSAKTKEDLAGFKAAFREKNKPGAFTTEELTTIQKHFMKKFVDVENAAKQEEVSPACRK